MAGPSAKPKRAKRKISKRGRIGEGRPSHKPTPQMQELVRTLFIAGWTEERICKVMPGVSPHTLRKHYRDQLDLGKAQVDAMVTQSIILMALGGQPVPGQPINWREASASMASFYAKTRMGWKEPPQALEHAGKDGGPILIGDIEITMKLAPPRSDDEDRSFRYGAGVVIPPGAEARR